MSVTVDDERAAAGRLRPGGADSGLELITDRLDCCPHCCAPGAVVPSMWGVRARTLVCGYECPRCRRPWVTRWALGTLAGAV